MKVLGREHCMERQASQNRGKNNDMIQETMKFNPQGQQFSLMDKERGKIENVYRHKQLVVS